VTAKKALRRRWEAHFLRNELVVAVLVTLAAVIWSEFAGGRGELDHFIAAHGATLYTVAAPIDAAMLGFILAAVAIVVTAAPDDRMALLRESAHYSELWDCFKSALRVLGAATVGSIVALAVTGTTASRILFFVVGGLTALAALRVARCIWALNSIVQIFTKPLASS
jgi:hypothetical protein